MMIIWNIGCKFLVCLVIKVYYLHSVCFDINVFYKMSYFPPDYH